MATNNGNKNAYEIRLEVLQAAISIAESAYYQQLDKRRFDAEQSKSAYELPEDTRVRDGVVRDGRPDRAVDSSAGACRRCAVRGQRQRHGDGHADRSDVGETDNGGRQWGEPT